MIERNDSFTDSVITRGTTVRYDGTDEPEFGVVVHCWLSSEIGMYDCYIAFFGSEVPKGTPFQKPYVLRYAAVSLARLEAASGHVR